MSADLNPEDVANRSESNRHDPPGGTEVMEMIDLPEPVAGPGQVPVEVAAAGVNFMDIGVRRGTIGRDIEYLQYWEWKESAALPRSARACGISCPVNASPVAYGPGSYAERVAIAADALVTCPTRSTIIKLRR
ncbi:hypothetical protein DLJ82_5715 (plasmid) [Rhizobium leguminosarum]|uniref:Uncharacterized protein n=1 Tax=Rhizobium leguminosarum TaxID=384 RepID=A0A2Z4YPY9_RHILE|nr:hypothetical protein DLJ82_5715 [Rhizobium leguminosarum]